MNHYRMYINGEFVESLSHQIREIKNPFDQSTVGTVPEATEQDATYALESAHRAFDDGKGPWPQMTPYQRKEFLSKIATGIRSQRLHLAELETLNQGKPIAEALGDVDATAELFEYYGYLATTIEGKIIPNPNPDLEIMVRYQPVGVCVGITPWNYPLSMTAWKLAPALAAGNTSIIKPSELTPLTTLALAQILHEAGLPPGVANIVTGAGSQLGTALISDPRVDKVAFTGGSITGAKIAAITGSKLIRNSMELGGKSALIVFKDAVTDPAAFARAVEIAAMAFTTNQGEVCSQASRLLLEEPIQEAFTQALVERVKKIKLGNGKDPTVHMGPLISPEHLARVESYIEAGLREGARLRLGGSRPEGADLQKGNFLCPTIFDQVTPNMTIAKEEIFGPVLSVMTFPSGANSSATEEAAVNLANGTDYGLAAGILTTNGARAVRVQNALRVGIVWVNTYDWTSNQAPWGGLKKSGYGRELGLQGLSEYLEAKQIVQMVST